MLNSVHELSFEQVAQDLSAPLLRYLHRLVGDRDAANDLLQETLIRISRGLGGFAGGASVKTWAFSIATRVAADHFRRPEQRLRMVAVSDIEDLPDSERSIHERIVVDEMNACVRQVIDGLPGDYRTALVLHDLEGMSADQVAEVCQCSRATAKIRIHRARARLAKALQRQCDFYRDGDSVLRCDRKP